MQRLSSWKLFDGVTVLLCLLFPWAKLKIAQILHVVHVTLQCGGGVGVGSLVGPFRT